jgi:beta-glucosidase
MTDNGCAYEEVCIDGKIDDRERSEYYRSYLEICSQAIDEGVHLSAYFAWSFMDNFEWASGYSKRFGLHYVDFDTLERVPKSSVKWFAKMIKKNTEKQLL